MEGVASGMLAYERSLQKGLLRGWIWGEMRFYTTGISFPILGIFLSSITLPFIPVWLRTSC